MLRNYLCHSPNSSITKRDFDDYVQLAKEAFTAVGFPTNRIDFIGSLGESDFPTGRVEELNGKNRYVVLENHKFLKETIGEGIATLTDNIELFRANIMEELQPSGTGNYGNIDNN